MRCKWMGWVFCKVLVFSLHFTSGLQSAVYPQFYPGLQSAVWGLRALADETQPQVSGSWLWNLSFPKAICLPEIYKRSRLFSEPFRRKYRKYQASQVPIKSTNILFVFSTLLLSKCPPSSRSRGFHTNFQVRQWTTNQLFKGWITLSTG